MGRGVFTKRDLQAGDLIGIEEMFSWTIMDECKYSRCLNCMKENYLMLIPCPNCTCAMFCSKKCLEDGTNKFHQYECPIINFMYDYLPSNFILTIRTLLNVINEFSTIKNCYTSCVESVTKNIYGDETSEFDFKDYKYSNGINLINSIYYDKSDAMAFFPYIPIIALLKYFLIRKTKLKEMVIEKEHQDFISEAMLLYTRIIQDSSYGSKIIFSEDSPEFQFLSPFESLFNHSCNPNVEHWIIGKKVYFLTLKPIKKGLQLLLNYCPDFGTLPKEHRILFLESRNFVCRCEACLKDYPTFNIEKAKNHKPKLYTRDFNAILSNMGKINDMTPKQAYTYLKQCSKFMEKYYYKFFPDQPVILIERLITKIISKLLGDESMKNVIKKNK
ncbi:SET domain-containing protein DDB_G0283443-like [Condylostylus longicornis]|uniref:SET domain-containing protein DDB_G0283443-like n=1 Tax=Condylostylus longicornis TaxID=2530218 RepID=UPI00244E3728|nr:SET domain-containing protein DDB_G0283443-like [Condylostylus longicornis]